MTTRTSPDAVARWHRARTEGAAADAGYSRREYALTLARGHEVITLAQCRFDDPTGTLQRVFRVRARWAARDLHNAMRDGAR